MSKLRLPQNIFTRTVTPSQSSLCSPLFSRSERNTYQSIDNLRNQAKDQLATVSTSRNQIKQKSEFLMKVDEKLVEKIKRKVTLQKFNSKMSILSMQRTKFKVSTNKSCFRTNPLSTISNTPSIFGGAQAMQTARYESILGRRQAGCYNITSELESFRAYLKIISLNHPKKNKGRKSEILTRCLLEYFINGNQKQVKKDLYQIKAISDELIKCLTDSSHSLDLNILRHVDRDIPKLIFNICYEVYRKKQKGVTHRQLVKINKQIQYTSRRLKFFDITLRTCFDLGRLYTDQMDYDKAFQQYTHAVKLTIFTGNIYYREIAIDKLGLCKYYLGDSVSAYYFHNNIHHLSEYDLNRIRENYSNDNEIKRLIQEKKQLKLKSRKRIQLPTQKRTSIRGNLINLAEKENITNQSFEDKLDIGEFTFSKQNRKQFYPVLNNMQLKSNLKKIIKIPQLRSKIHILKDNLKKNDQIGTKRYCGQNYIVPTASMCSRKQNSVQHNEVCLSHRSYNRNDIQNDTAKVVKDSKIIIMTLNYFINQNYMGKSKINQIIEEPNQNEHENDYENQYSHNY